MTLRLLRRVGDALHILPARHVAGVPYSAQLCCQVDQGRHIDKMNLVAAGRQTTRNRPPDVCSLPWSRRQIPSGPREELSSP